MTHVPQLYSIKFVQTVWQLNERIRERVVLSLTLNTFGTLEQRD